MTRIDELVEQQDKLVALATIQKPNNPQKGQENWKFKDKIQAIAK